MPPDSLSVGQVIAEAGLNGDRYKACAGDIFSLFQKETAKRAVQIGKDIISDSLEQYKAQLSKKIMCRAEAFINHLCIYGNCEGGGVPCTQPIGSDTNSNMKITYINRLKSAFLASCMSLYSLKFTGDTVDHMIQTQGPGGAPAYATDWITDAYVRPAEQAQRRMWSILANTNICPYFREEALNYFGVPQSYRDAPPIVNAMGLRVNEDPPFQVRAACTIPSDFDPTDLSADTFMKQGGYMLISELNESQNNLEGFISIATAELSNQKEAALKATSDQLVGSGGYLAIVGNKSDGCTMDPEGKCITDGTIQLPPGAVRDSRNIDLAANYDYMLKNDGENSIAMTDMGARLQARLMSLANKPIPLNLELGPDSQASNFTPAPTPTPIGDPNDPACTGGDPRCTCVTNDPGAQSIGSTTLTGAATRVMQGNPELFVTGTNQIAPGVSYRTVLQALCTSLGSFCTPHPSRDTDVVFTTGDGLSISFEIITTDGFLRTNGGKPLAQCEAGVVN
jgi:hypothetical protein